MLTILSRPTFISKLLAKPFPTVKRVKYCVTYPEVHSGNTNTNVKHYRWNLEGLFAGRAIKRVRAGSGVAVGNFPLRKCYSHHCFTKLALTASASSFMNQATLDIKTLLRLHFENRLYTRKSMSATGA